MSNYFWKPFLFSATCPRGWLRVINGSCYGFSDDQLPWNSAKSACEKLGAKLVVLNTEAEQKALTPAVARVIWIGLHRDPKNKARWLWVDESHVDYTNWMKGEPNHQDTEHCAEMYSTHWAGKWNDDNCIGRHHYVCEISGR